MTDLKPSHNDTPDFSHLDLSRSVRQFYAIEASVEALPSYIDQNFLLNSSDGRRYVLKIANASENADLLDLQNRAMMYLHQKAPEIGCPKVLSSQNGNELENLRDSAGNVFQLRLLSYLPGKFLTDVTFHSPKLLESFGRFLGKMDAVLLNFSHPSMRRYLDWDFSNALHMLPRLKCITSPSISRIAAYFYLQFETEILPVFHKLPGQVIHNDANDHNVLTDRGGISGIIDFGDLMFTRRIAELAIACTYVMMGKTDPISAAAKMVQGYHAVNPLQNAEIETIFYLVGTRLAMSLSKSAAFKQEDPENEYIAISEKPAIELIERLVEVNPERAVNMFREVCGIPRYVPGRNQSAILKTRRDHLGQNLSISYRQPIKITRGALQYLFDDSGQTYLDCVNNVSHVGHCHPSVVHAIRDQAARLNTNTRYLHDGIVAYAERLTATMPDPLTVCFFVNSGSEANDLALRLARNYTGQKDCIVIDAAYHGHLSSIIELSPYKFDGPGGGGCPPYTKVVPLPDLYRGKYRRNDPLAGEKYARDVHEAIVNIEGQGRGVAAFFAESLLGCGGQVVLPNGYLQQAFTLVRDAGGLCIADEVQVGFGRVGSHWWGFETQEVVPDIVTLGKPIGNAHPMAAVITTIEIADAFANGMEYFNTFGGNPVSCAVGLAVLDVIEREKLRENAQEVGNYFLQKLRELQQLHAIIGDVRGMGLFIGVELVRDHATLEPAGDEAADIVNHMKEHGVLLSTDGPHHNVIKIKPPLVFNSANVDRVVETLDLVLRKYHPV